MKEPTSRTIRDTGSSGVAKEALVIRRRTTKAARDAREAAEAATDRTDRTAVAAADRAVARLS